MGFKGSRNVCVLKWIVLEEWYFGWRDVWEEVDVDLEAESFGSIAAFGCTVALHAGPRDS